MKKQKVLSCLLAGVMALSMTACGNDAATSNTETGATTPETTPAPVVEEEASIDFEDGNMAFAEIYTLPANADPSELSIVDYNGSKALQVKSVNGQVPYVAIDATSLLGADVTKVASMEFTVGVTHDDGKFSAVAGVTYAWSGADRIESSDEWSVYLESANPKKAVATLDAGEEFVADAGNMFIISMSTDNGAASGISATMYIDNIRFLDKDGNLLKADSSAAFNAPEGFVKTGHDANLLYVDNEVELEGFAVSAGAWAQAGIELTDEQRALFVPGSVITINYKSDAPVWMVAICSDANPNPLGGWLRGVNQDTFVVDGAVSADGSSVQYTYEQLVAYWGEDFGQYLGTLQCESSADWEVYSVTVGKPIKPAHNVTNLDGFAVSAGAWAQAGIELTDEQRALLVPGSVITINYKSDAPVWMVAISSDANPNPLGGWLRGVNQDTFVVDGAVSADGSSVQYTYEQLAAYWGEDFGQYVGTLQCESSADWEVYSVSVGMAE